LQQTKRVGDGEVMKLIQGPNWNHPKYNKELEVFSNPWEEKPCCRSNRVLAEGEMLLWLIDTLGDDSSDNDRTNRNPNRQIVKIPARYREHLNHNINLKEFPELRKGVKPTKTTAEGQ
jgi:hypothetical protein